ncbi:MAG: hypothetical protein V7782_16625 [Psychromonas sp.]
MTEKHFILGGDIKKSLSDGYKLDFKPLFKSAFSITKKNYFSLIIACVFTMAILLAGYALILESTVESDETLQLLTNLVFSALVMTPLITGLQMMGVHHSIGLKTKATSLFNYYNILLKLALASVLINLCVFVITSIFTELMGDIGVQISLVILLYLNMTFSLVYPLIAEKKLSPQMAIKISFKLVNKNLRQFTLLHLILGLLAVVAVLPSGLGLFLFVPFYFNLMGIIYRQVCGVGVVATETTKSDDDNDNNDDNNKTGFEA